MTDHHNEFIIRTIRELSAPLYPVSTDVEPTLRPLNEIKVVVFDVYGTLFISDSGDIGLFSIERSICALSESLGYLDMAADRSAAAERGVALLRQTIAEHHAKRMGIDYPEVNIDDVWIEVLERLYRENLIRRIADYDQRLALMIRYEFQVNPVWQMPGLPDVLENLLNNNIILGIISNAQFFSPYIFQALLDKSVRDCGFNDRLCIWSYQYLEAKPSPELFSHVGEPPGPAVCPPGNDGSGFQKMPEARFAFLSRFLFRRQGGVGLRQVLGPLMNASLQLVACLPKGFLGPLALGDFQNDGADKLYPSVQRLQGVVAD